MANMRDMLLWMQQQQQKPEFAAAKKWLERNQTAITPKATPAKDVQIVDEKPADKD
jgi:hypothetical protein